MKDTVCCSAAVSACAPGMATHTSGFLSWLMAEARTYKLGYGLALKFGRHVV